MKKLLISTGVSLLLMSSAWAVNGSQNVAADVCFTPSGQCGNLIVKTIAEATQSIDVQAENFTSQPIADALVAAQKRGVKVKVLLDKVNVNSRNSVVSLLTKNKVPFLIDYKPAVAYNKVILIDNKTVITGNFAFTKAAETQDAGNILIMRNPEIAGIYQSNFDKRQKDSEQLATYCQSSTKCQLESVANKAVDATSKAANSAWSSTKEFWNKHTS
ncbi:phospholipase D family nuclease [Piscirickettsia litoralis]|uniref:phospholipase D n=1 Tax=Piscirickettsia litoralis TaxID=1891921 RepID=A0ABX3A458_9GAMM|nr:phospholipase D family protein [Piscirickettsia litoralis]ODN43652.1 PLD-like domain protein [Piscirickettsia litoralis]